MAYDYRRGEMRFRPPRHCHLHNPCEQKRPKSRSTPGGGGRWNWNEIPSPARNPAAAWIIIGR